MADYEDLFCKTTTSQIGATIDFEEAAEKKTKRKIWGTRHYNPFDLFYKDFRLWHTDKSLQDMTVNEVRIRKKAIKAWHDLDPPLKLQYEIIVGVQMAQDKKLKELLQNRRRLPNQAKADDAPNPVPAKRRRVPRKHGFNVTIMERFLPRHKAHRTVVRRPTPIPKNLKSKRPKELPKFIPLPIEKNKPLN
ncbi:hypothetical protein KR067_000249 [Drosophila pandora]|nr:hypothetical protein KR067_000249 [Drosophila pandora]